MAGLVAGDLLRWAFSNDTAASGTAFGPEIDDPVGGFDHIQVMFDDDNSVAAVHKPLQNGQEHADILEVQACGGFIQNVERPAGGLLGQFPGQLDALGFAAA